VQRCSRDQAKHNSRAKEKLTTTQLMRAVGKVKHEDLRPKPGVHRKKGVSAASQG
jgi:hypothetical protein